jgi:hypothetical protein
MKSIAVGDLVSIYERASPRHSWRCVTSIALVTRVDSRGISWRTSTSWCSTHFSRGGDKYGQPPGLLSHSDVAAVIPYRNRTFVVVGRVVDPELTMKLTDGTYANKLPPERRAPRHGHKV